MFWFRLYCQHFEKHTRFWDNRASLTRLPFVRPAFSFRAPTALASINTYLFTTALLCFIGCLRPIYEMFTARLSVAKIIDAKLLTILINQRRLSLSQATVCQFTTAFLSSLTTSLVASCTHRAPYRLDLSEPPPFSQINSQHWRNKTKYQWHQIYHPAINLYVLVPSSCRFILFDSTPPQSGLTFVLFTQWFVL